MGVRHHHGHRGAAAAGAGTGDIMGRLAWRHGRSRAPFRPWRAVHRPRVHHRGREFGMLPSTGTVGDSYDNAMAGSADGACKTELVWRRKPFRDLRDLELATFRWVSWRGLEASAPVLGLQDTGTDRNRVLCEPSGASRPTIRAEQKSGHISCQDIGLVGALR